MNIIHQALRVSIEQLASRAPGTGSYACYYPTYVSLNRDLPIEDIGSCLEIERVTIPAMIARSILRAMSERRVTDTEHPIHDHIGILIDIANKLSSKLISYLDKRELESFVWNYIPSGNNTSLPNDIDDTSIAVEALSIFHYLIDRDVDLFDKIRNSYSKILYDQLDEGLESRYRTWVTAHPSWNNVDPVVNANICSACIRLNLLNFIPREYIQKELEQNSTKSEFYCAENMFEYAVSPYLEALPSQNHSPRQKSTSDDGSLLSDIFTNIYRARSTRIIDQADVLSIAERITDLAHRRDSVLQALYIEQIKGGVISYALSPEIYFALYIELISLCDYQLINNTDNERSNSPFVEQNYSEYIGIVQEGSFANDENNGDEDYRRDSDQPQRSLDN